MEEKLNWKAIDSYSLNFSGRIVEQFFTQKDHISGKEILSISPVKQVNFFILDELLKAWKNESEKLKSPYFDFESEDVKEALHNFLNVLSNHILIHKGHFAPLIKSATTQTLLLIFAPYDFFSMYIKDKAEINLDELRERLKYIKVNKAPLEGLAEEITKRGKTKLSGAEAFKILDHILEELNFSPADFEEYIGQFSSIVSLNPEQFYTSHSAPEKAVSKSSEPVKQAVNAGKQQTLYDQLAKTDRPSLADDFQKQKIKKLKDSLSINHKFMFVNVLFKGNTDNFNKAIDFIDSCADRSVAFRYIQETFPDWNDESEEFIEFIELVEKRFL